MAYTTKQFRCPTTYSPDEGDGAYEEHTGHVYNLGSLTVFFDVYWASEEEIDRWEISCIDSYFGCFEDWQPDLFDSKRTRKLQAIYDGIERAIERTTGYTFGDWCYRTR